MKNYCEFEARLDSLDKVKDFLTAHLVEEQIGADVFFDLNVAIEEVFTNIVKYGQKRRQADKIGIHLKVDAESAKIEISDRGIAFNPLAVNEPELDLALEERKLGGLGIFLVKQLMDEVHYRRYEKKNILSLKKKLSVHRDKKE